MVSPLCVTGRDGVVEDAPAKLRDYGTTRLRDHGTARLRDYETTRLRDYETPEKHRRSQAFSGVLRLSQPFEAAHYRTWLISEFREIREFRDVRAMPATNQVSDVVPLNRAVRSLTSLISLNSLNSLLPARYCHAPKRDEFGVRRMPSATLDKRCRRLQLITLNDIFD